jgi:hypothetical protein
MGRCRAELTAVCQAFRGTLGARVVVCRPTDPEAKGLIERAHDYLERSFLAGRNFAGPADFNGQLQQWLAIVNARPRRVLGCAPADRITADKAAMMALPPVALATGWRASARPARDHYVRLDGNDYSVHPACVGRRIEVTAGCASARRFRRLRRRRCCLSPLRRLGSRVRWPAGRRLGNVGGLVAHRVADLLDRDAIAAHDRDRGVAAFGACQWPMPAFQKGSEALELAGPSGVPAPARTVCHLLRVARQIICRYDARDTDIVCDALLHDTGKTTQVNSPSAVRCIRGAG